jgi:alanyl-tRNA synthetase
MQTADIHRRWLTYFGDRGHTVVPSASLVSDDPTLLFTVAGMVPFVPYLTGLVPAPYPRATSVQKCIRTLDIEEVGKTPRHGTFFQMNGNFSFGDYFKEGAISYAWDLLTSSEADGGLGFDEKDLWVTVYKDDDEAISLWKKIAGLPDERIQRLDMDTNYWSTGQPGPAGPFSTVRLRFLDESTAPTTMTTCACELSPTTYDPRSCFCLTELHRRTRGAGTSCAGLCVAASELCGCSEWMLLASPSSSQRQGTR